MSITSGFYDSLNGDRKYNAKQMSDIFNGIINDGVFAVGEAFATKAASGNVVTVDTGRAWFNSTWVYNDAIISLNIPARSSSAYDLVDLLVLEVNHSADVRAASVKFVEQYIYTDTTVTDLTQRRTAAIDAAIDKQLTNSLDVHQYPIAAVYRLAGTTDDVTQEDITYLVGSSSCPMVTGIIDVMTIDNIVAQWQNQFDVWFAKVINTMGEDIGTSLTQQVVELRDDFDAHKHSPEDINTEGYLGAKVMASPVEVANVGAPQVRNIYAGTEDMYSGETTLPTGAIYLVYE